MALRSLCTTTTEPGATFSCTCADQAEELRGPALEVGERRAEEHVDRLGRRLPALAPAVDVGPGEDGAVGDAELLQVLLDLGRDAEVAFHEGDRGWPRG